MLLAIFSTYTCRDIWPLITIDGTPQDVDEGPFLWAKLIIITITAVFIPLFIPRRYVPVDPTEPTVAEPNPEQTASIFSFLFYFFLDDIIFKASKVDHLSYTELPQLADYDRARYLRETGLHHLDPFSGTSAKPSHLFFRLLRVFWREYSVLSVNIVIQVITTFGAPLGINRILSYLEYGPSSTNIRLWFWIGWLFFGPLAYSLSRQAYIYTTTSTTVRAESLLTQLVFEHSLRIRMKAETGSNTTVPGTGCTREGTQAKKPAVGNMIGKMNNLITSDLYSITEGRDFLIIVIFIPLQICLGILFLYNVLGVSAFVGLASMIIFSPLPRFVVMRLGAIQKEKMRLTDARVQAVTEIVNVLRMVKMFAWESRMAERLEQSRDIELRFLWKRRIYDIVNQMTNYTISALIMLSTFAFYTLVMKQQLSAAKVFSSMPVFNLLRTQMYMLSATINRIVQGKVALDRLDEFLQNTELLDVYAPLDKNLHKPEYDTDVIGFKDCLFAWSNEDDGSTTSSFRLRIQGELFFKKGCINLITGPTGTGKTSMLMALLGEMHFISSAPDAWFNLPRVGGLAYAAQESWVQNDTIRNNILFGSSFDEDRYNKVIHQCALKQDIELFEAGDQTEVGERGLTLSGGQKARVTLARAIYSSAEIILLDDVLAALDAHTSKWIVEECLLGDIVKGRTVLLVTHNVTLTLPTAHFIVEVGIDGRISKETLAPLDHLPKKILQIVEDIHTDDLAAASEIEEKELNSPKPDGKLIVAEDIAKGRVGWRAMKLYLSSLGGRYPISFFLAWIAGSIASDSANNFQMWYLGYWGSQYAPGHSVQASYYLSIYSLLLTATVIIRSSVVLHYSLGTIRASRLIHSTLIGSIMRSTMRWLDETPVSRIIARCTQDIGAIDDPLAMAWSAVVELMMAGMVKLGSVVIITPVFLVPGLAVVFVGSWTASIYLRAQLSVKREMSNAKAPVLAHFGATIAGIVSVRAFGARHAFRQELMSRIDHYARVARVSNDLNRWIAVRMDLLGSLFTASLALYLVLTRNASASNTGFSLTIALELCTTILWWVRLYNDFEIQSNSLERIQSYIDIDQEKHPTEAGKPPASWPTSGDLRAENLSARYSTNGPEVLHQLTFQISSGERIGVVGRTGSGKSTLTLALLRCILTEGRVYYDGVDTDQMNLDALRSNINIIPQVPELLSGTLRLNLDPFEEHDDAELNSVLKHAGLLSLQSDSVETRITLDTKIASAGSNLSIGQRQIIALARAMVRKSKLLILDEATSAIDYRTDVLIQDALRSKLSSDVTVIIVAHRLQTIMDADKIMVLDAGSLVEFDTPAALLRKEDGVFKRLVDNSGDRGIAYK
ncbi:multidrug resistance-associated ABC transporter [Cyathus striatus]|nr:multidrug resistance-associated ABC transporter [Cyathus striatus]